MTCFYIFSLAYLGIQVLACLILDHKDYGYDPLKVIIFLIAPIVIGLGVLWGAS